MKPTIGLHSQDIGRLVKFLGIASTGNMVCVVEHDEQVIRAIYDKVIEMGPQPGIAGRNYL